MIKLDVEASEGESLDSNVFRAAVEANRLARSGNANSVDESGRNSHDLAHSMLKDKSKEDSTRVLAQQIESLRDMERQNEYMTS